MMRSYLTEGTSQPSVIWLENRNSTQYSTNNRKEKQKWDWTGSQISVMEIGRHVKHTFVSNWKPDRFFYTFAQRKSEAEVRLKCCGGDTVTVHKKNKLTHPSWGWWEWERICRAAELNSLAKKLKSKKNLFYNFFVNVNSQKIVKSQHSHSSEVCLWIFTLKS